MDNNLRKSLSNLNILNWVDFYSWKQDYDNAIIHEIKKIDDYIKRNQPIR